METAPLRAYLVDDEPLAIERLARLLANFDCLRIAGSATDPAQALEFLNGDARCRRALPRHPDARHERL